MDSWKNKKVLIMGLGMQGGGVGVARYFARHGALVTVTDLRGVEDLQKSVAELAEFRNISYRLGEHKEEDFISADCIVKGPSVLWTNIFIQKAIKRKIPVIMETAYFAKHTKARMIGVTGTRGKSTTTTYIYRTLKHLYTKGQVYIAGNIPGTCAIELLDEAKANDIVVLELSSWQLSGFHRAKISPQIAVFTNIYEDHLNYYHVDMQKYVYDKTAIFSYQKPDGIFISPTKTLSVLSSHNVSIPSQIIECYAKDFPGELLHVRGQHNKLNAALALNAVICILPELDRLTVADYIRNLEALRFRQEIIGVIDDVVVVNDSTSTTPISVITAIETFKDKKIVLVMGGNSKKLSTNDLINVIETNKDSILSIILLKGTMTDEIASRLSTISNLHVSPVYEDFDAAIHDSVKFARELHEPTYLLFTPGATSFAQFHNEFERGAKFSQIISDIMKK